MALIQKGLARLINTLARGDQALFQVLNGLNDQTIAIINQINSDELILLNFIYRFELANFPAVGNDVYPVWKQVRFPLDASVNTIGTGQQITRIDINAKTAPVTQDFIVDILVTKDKGVSFQSIFPATNIQKLRLPIGLKWSKYGGSFALAADTLQDNWWFRVDVLQSDGQVQGPEIVIRGSLTR